MQRRFNWSSYVALTIFGTTSLAYPITSYITETVSNFAAFASSHGLNYLGNKLGKYAGNQFNKSPVGARITKLQTKTLSNEVGRLMMIGQLPVHVAENLAPFAHAENGIVRLAHDESTVDLRQVFDGEQVAHAAPLKLPGWCLFTPDILDETTSRGLSFEIGRKFKSMYSFFGYLAECAYLLNEARNNNVNTTKPIYINAPAFTGLNGTIVPDDPTWQEAFVLVFDQLTTLHSVTVPRFAYAIADGAVNVATVADSYTLNFGNHTEVVSAREFARLVDTVLHFAAGYTAIQHIAFKLYPITLALMAQGLANHDREWANAIQAILGRETIYRSIARIYFTVLFTAFAHDHGIPVLQDLLKTFRLFDDNPNAIKAYERAWTAGDKLALAMPGFTALMTLTKHTGVPHYMKDHQYAVAALVLLYVAYACQEYVSALYATLQLPKITDLLDQEVNPEVAPEPTSTEATVTPGVSTDQVEILVQDGWSAWFANHNPWQQAPVAFDASDTQSSIESKGPLTTPDTPVIATQQFWIWIAIVDKVNGILWPAHHKS